MFGRKYGKLLIAIDEEFNTYLELANLKKMLTFILLAVLIVAAIPAFVLPNAKANVNEVTVVSKSFYVAASAGTLASKAGDLVVVGEVKNVGSGFVQNVTLSATALDANGTTLGTASTPASGTVFSFETPPQEKVPFIIDFASSNSWSSQVATVDVTVVSVLDGSPPPGGLGFVDTPTALVGNPYTEVGTIQNNSSQTIQYLWVVTTFYNSADQVVALNWTSFLPGPGATISPKGAVHYVATPVDNSATLSSEITSAAYVIDAIPAGSSSNTQSTTPTPGAGGGSSSPFPTLPIIVVVVVVVVAVAALMLLRKRQGTETPLPPPPPPPTAENS